MAKTNTDLVREVSIEIAVHRHQIQNLTETDHTLVEMIERLRDRISERDVRDAVRQQQIDDLRAKQGDLEARWKWMMATFVGLLLSIIIALFAVIARR